MAENNSASERKTNMRIFTAIGLVLMIALIHGCGTGGNAEQNAADTTPATAPAAIGTPSPPSGPAALTHAVDPATLALMIDPVCKMSFEEYAVETTAEHAGKDYGFCSEFCKKNFAKDPDKILARLTETTSAP
jgi:YHS domain-containing protein